MIVFKGIRQKDQISVTRTGTVDDTPANPGRTKTTDRQGVISPFFRPIVSLALIYHIVSRGAVPGYVSLFLSQRIISFARQIMANRMCEVDRFSANVRFGVLGAHFAIEFAMQHWCKIIHFR
jgi:hypothetical protein